MTQSTEVRDAIWAVDQKFMAAFNRSDAAGLAALYTQDGQVLPPNSDFVTGREAIQAFWQGVMDMGIKGATLELLEAEGLGYMACSVGKYTLKGEEGQVLDAGKFVVIWKQEAGEWKLHRDMFNSSMPPPE
jgi:uncharacterized protein (TIGR02246 family)